jgi:N-acyl-phosphatidylethanolamine-hydrolysing phospholipase D
MHYLHIPIVIEKYMKKFFFFFIQIFLFSAAWADLNETYNSLDAVLNEPYRFWYLSINDKGMITKASTIGRIYYRVTSFLSNFHKVRLEKALEYSLAEAAKYNEESLDDKKKISLDKICSILSNGEKKFWFHRVSIPSQLCQEEKWTFTRREAEADHNLMLPYKRNGYFFNDEFEEIPRLSIVEISVFIKSLFTSRSSMDLKKLVQHDPVLPRSGKLNIQWLGHASFLIQIEGLNILVDPVTEAFHPLFGGLVKCFKRYVEPGVTLNDLPKIDVVMISHNHLDHLEDKALFYLKRYQPQVIVPQGLKKYFDGKGFNHIEEFVWWDGIVASTKSGKEIGLYCVPARHNSMTRGKVKRQESLWSGWVIDGRKKHIYFAGDTAFNGAMFRQIRERFGPIDVALLPVAPDKMWERHIDHLEALRALDILGGKAMIPMHWGAYRTGDEKVEEPYLRMKKEKEENPKFNGRIKILKVGQRYSED